MNPVAPFLAQARETLDAADRLGHATPAVILAAAVVLLVGVVVYLARENTRLHGELRAQAEKHAKEASETAAAQAEHLHSLAIAHATELREQSEAHAAQRAADHAANLADMRASHAQDVGRLDRLSEAARALTTAVEAMTDAKETFRDSTTPVSTPAPRRGR